MALGAIILSTFTGCVRSASEFENDRDNRPDGEKRLNVQVREDNVFYNNEMVGTLPQSGVQKAQKVLESAGFYPKLPNGVLVPEITVLNDGRIWLSGGVGKNNTYSRETWFFDPKSKQLSKGPELKSESIKHACLVLKNGKVLISGGSTARPQEIGLIQILDPQKNQIQTLGNLVFWRYEHSMVELAPGVVAITGGATRNGDQDEVEIFDMNKKTSRMVGHLAVPRKQHQSLKIDDKKLLLLQGRGFEFKSEELGPEVFVIPESK